MRTILFVLALLGAVAGRAQIFLDWYGAAAPAAGLLLDDYPNAAAAYSLRLLNSAYTGNCIEVRRASTNTNQNIGFVGGVLDTAALKTFCASTDCFVTTWYDQSGGGWNATQATSTRQPLIVSGGVVNRLNGRPSLFFDGTDVLQTATLGTYAGVITSFAVFNFSSAGACPYIYDQGSIRYILYFDASFIRIYMQADLIDGGRTLGQQYATYALYNLTSSAFKINTLSYTGSTGTAFQNATLITLGAPSNLFASAFLTGNIQEFVTYRSNESSNESGIRGNINAFYNVY
jgi:hypothetical protein